MRGYSIGKDDYQARLRRIEGQVRGLQRMIDEEIRRLIAEGEVMQLAAAKNLETTEDEYLAVIIALKQLDSLEGAEREAAIAEVRDNVRDVARNVIRHRRCRRISPLPCCRRLPRRPTWPGAISRRP